MLCTNDCTSVTVSTENNAQAIFPRRWVKEKTKYTTEPRPKVVEVPISTSHWRIDRMNAHLHEYNDEELHSRNVLKIESKGKRFQNAPNGLLFIQIG